MSIRRLCGAITHSPTYVRVSHLFTPLHVAPAVGPVNVGGDLQGRPDEARQLPRHRDHDFARGFVLRLESSESPTQPLLRLVGNGDYAGRLTLPSLRQAGAHAGSMLIVPAGFDQHAARERIAGLRDPATPMPVATGGLN